MNKKIEGAPANIPDIIIIMPIKKRFIVILMLFSLALAVYGLAELYAPSLVYFVVEQTLIEKSPPGTDTIRLHLQLSSLLSSAPDQNAKMEILFRISGYLEKVQSLTPVQLDEVMEVATPTSEIHSGLPVFVRKWNFFRFQDV